MTFLVSDISDDYPHILDTVFALDEDTVRSDLCDMPVKHFMGDIDALSGDDESSDDGNR